MTTPDAPQKIFITGGTGFLGREIVLKLSAAHPTWHLTIFDLAQPSSELLSVPNTTYILGDMLDPDVCEAALRKSAASCVIHTAGVVTPLVMRYSKKFRPQAWRINVEGTRSVLAAAQKVESVRAFVYTGSCCAVIDDFRYKYPAVDETWRTTADVNNTVYGESKAVAEAEVLAANRRGGEGGAKDGQFLTCSLRPSTLFGDTDSQLLTGIHSLIASGETPFIIGDGQNLWDVCHAANVADAHVLAVDNLLLTFTATAAGEAFFIGNDEPITFRAFCCAIWREFGHHPRFEVTVPTSLAKAVGLVAENVSWLLGRDPGLSRAAVADATAIRYADGRKARRILGYVPKIPLHEGIPRSCHLYKKSLEGKAKVKA